MSPRTALARADGEPGRAAGDAALLLVLLVLAVYPDRLVTAGHYLVAGELSTGFSELFLGLSHGVSGALFFLVGAVTLQLLLSWGKREIGTHVDRCCVGLVPTVLVALVANAIVLCADWQPSSARLWTNIFAYSWGGLLVLYAAVVARRAPEERG